MAIFSWLKRFKRRPVQPEVQWSIAVDEDRIRTIDHAGTGGIVAKLELTGVAIETNDSGPWGTDLWWLLSGLEGKLAGAVPGGATGETNVVNYVMTLPGFDERELTRAMASTDNAISKLWERRADAPDPN